ncbi:hypothetical protein AKJ41_01140 [candidate division MSBL1 archaeon SCGC-AAA259O05]|uniref:Uncharacterized protein n=1 Tax=candidate division MSBL1 archaeon SCGC-AAA259O05 TaxID=1698271 RepID=A0A133V559_9EURY|nr:hypothetical protein AKJ41_01140 [candidate division MSBL1 archaeon SCGC-AAA259O05]
MKDSSRRVAKRLSGKVELGDRILAEGELKDVKTGGFYNMPCPFFFRRGKRSIFLSGGVSSRIFR